MSEKLKPCPFCGGEGKALDILHTNWWSDKRARASGRVHCASCGVSIPWIEATHQQIIDFLNKTDIEIWKKGDDDSKFTKLAHHTICKELRRQAIKVWNRRPK